jgi:hypothetical protein
MAPKTVELLCPVEQAVNCAVPTVVTAGLRKTGRPVLLHAKLHVFVSRMRRKKSR